MGREGRQTHMQDGHVTTAGLAKRHSNRGRRDRGRGKEKGWRGGTLWGVPTGEEKLRAAGRGGKGCVRALLTLILTAAESV